MALQTNVTSTSEPTISDIEQTVQNGLEALRDAPLNEQITAALKFLTPPGYRPIAQFEEDGRKKRSTASASNWNPETGEIVIYFERTKLDSVPPMSPERHAAGRSRINAASSQASAAAALLGLDFESRLRRIREDSGLSNDPYVPDPLPTFDTGAVTPWQIQQCCEALAEVEKAGKAFIALKWFRDQGLTSHGYSWAESLACRQAVLTKAIEEGAILTTQIPNPRAPQHPTTTVKLNRESEHALSVPPRYQPIRAKGGASASEIILRDRGRF
jgi:hypothetical protein